MNEDDDLVLGFFKNLEESKRQDKSYPGTTPPRNAVTTRNATPNELEWLTHLRFTEYLVGGVKRKFYTIGSLAAALGKKPVTIRSWETKGWLPQPKWRTPKPTKAQIPGKEAQGMRLYSEDQLVFLVKAYNEYVEESHPPNWDAFRNYIKRQYPNT